MKKIFTLAVLTLFGALSMQAQNITINKTDGSKITVSAAEIQSIEFTPATVETIAGKYKGNNSLMVGGVMGPYVANGVTYTVEQNQDGSINLTSSVEQYLGTDMGDLTLGSYTIKNIAYNETSKNYKRDYGKDGVTVHFKSVANGQVGFDADYTFNEGSNVMVTKESDGTLRIVNSFMMGRMPFGITGTFSGKK